MTISPTGTFSDITVPPGYYDQFEWVVAWHTDPTPDGFFAATQFYLDGSNGATYAGVQTDASGINGGAGGKGVVFSQAGTILDRENLNPGGAIDDDFDGGLGVSIRSPLDWAIDDEITVTITRSSSTSGGGRWITCTASIPGGPSITVGRIKVPAGWGGMAGPLYFLERYSGPIATCSDISLADVRFTDFVASVGGDDFPASSFFNHPYDPPTCPNWAIDNIAGGVRHRMGGALSTPPDPPEPVPVSLGPRAHAAIYERDNATFVCDTTQPREDEPDLWWALRSDAKASKRQNEDGSGNIELDHDHPKISELKLRRVVRLMERLTDDEGDEVEHVRAAFTINALDWVEVSQDGESELATSAEGVGLLARLRDMRVLSWLPLGAKPKSAMRVFNFASPDLPEDLFDGTIYQQTRAQQAEGMRRPVAQPEPVSSWVAGYPDLESHPIGDQHIRRHVHFDAPTEVVIFGTADDRFSWWWDGCELETEDPEFPADVWWYCYRTGFLAPPGDHVFACRFSNDGGPSAAIVSAWTTDGTSIVTPLFLTGVDEGNPFIGDWLLSPVREVAPGYTGTAIVTRLVAEAVARGCDPVTLNFTTTHDSNGVAVPIIPEIAARVGQHTVRDVLDLLEPWYNFAPDDEGLALNMYLKETTPTASGVDLQRGTNLLRLTHRMEG